MMAASMDLHTRSVDFQNAFCQAKQETPLYIELPKHYKVRGREHEDLVLDLQKSLYGTVTAPKQFYEHIDAGMRSEGFVPSESDPCLYIHKEHQVMVLKYVKCKRLVSHQVFAQERLLVYQATCHEMVSNAAIVRKEV